MSNVFDILAAAAGLLPWVPGAIVVIGGLWARVLLQRPPRSERPERGAAKALAVFAAILGGIGLGMAGLIGVTGIADVPGPTLVGLVFAVVVGVGGGVATYLAGIAGYALLARRRVGSIAVVGALVVPAVFGWSTMTLAVGARSIEQAARDAAALERGSRVVLEVEEAIPKYDGEDVDTVHMVVTVQMEEPISFGTFYLAPDGRPSLGGFMGESVYFSYLTPDPQRFELEFRYHRSSGGDRPPGAWVLTLWMTDGDGSAYRITTPVELVGPAAGPG